MSSAAAIAFPSLVGAINFLTYPLFLVIPQPTVKSTQQILLSTLSTTPAWLSNARLTLKFAPTAPPRAVLIACAAAHVDWSDWFYVLGGREFDMTIERNIVFIQVTGTPGRTVIWKRVPTIRPTLISSVVSLQHSPSTQASINKPSQPPRLSKVSPIIPANQASSLPSRTVAQQLLQSEHEKEEADEIFAMISNLDACIISSTPICERFDGPKAPVTRLPAPVHSKALSALPEEVLHPGSSSYPPNLVHGRATPSPDSSSDSSRSSSPSSLLSYSSSQESLTSISTTSSVLLSSSSKTPTRPFITTNKRNPTVRRREPASRPVVVDSPETRVQRYLYQGGQSTTLTGGVMLGAPTEAPPTPSMAKKIRNPVARNHPPRHRRVEPHFRPGSDLVPSTRGISRS